MSILKGLKTVAECEEIHQTPIEKTFTAYWFVHSDYQEGLNYPVGKELINRGLIVIGETLGETLKEVEDALPAEKYLELMRPLLSRVRAKLDD